MGEVTLISSALVQGQGAEELFSAVYDELRRLAAWHLANEQPGQLRRPAPAQGIAVVIKARGVGGSPEAD